MPAVTGAVALKGYLSNEFSEIWKYEEGTSDKTAVEKEKKWFLIKLFILNFYLNYKIFFIFI